MINRGHLRLLLLGLFVLSLGGNLLWAQTPLSCGDRIEGEISTAGERDIYRFQGSQGEAIQVVGESMDPGLQLEIRVLDPSGELIGSKSIASPRSGSIQLPKTGQYRLEVRDFLDEATGRYALSLQFTTGRCAVAVDCGESREGPVSKRAEQAAFSFEGHAGEAVRVTAGLESSASKYPVVEVFGPGGDRLGWSPSGDSGSLVLTEDGTHTLLLSGFYSFFEQPHPDGYGVSLQFSTGQCATLLGDGGVLERSVDSLVQQDAVAFEAGASSWVHLESEALDYDPWTPRFTLFDQLGTQVETAAGSPVDFFIPRDGSYTAVAASRGVPHRTFRARLGLPASRLTAVTGRLYQSPIQHSAVAFSSRHDEYLAVYALDVSGFGEYEIYGRLLDAADLQPRGAEIRISRMGPDLDPQFQAADPDVAYDPVGDRYLVVWSGEKSTDGKFEVFGQFVSAGTGTPIGQDDFSITSTGSATNTAFGAFRPKVRSLSSSSQFFLVWYADTRQDGAFDVFGQRLSANGLPVGSPVRLNGVAATNAVTSSRNPSLAYDADRGEFLVVWQGPGSTGAVSAVRSVRVNAGTGTAVSPGEFIISDTTDEAPPASSDAPPDVSFSRSEGVYLVVWSSAGGRILGRRLDAATGIRLGYGATPLNTGSGGSLPEVSRTGAGREFLVAWQQELSGGELEIVGQRIDSANGLRKGEFELRLSRVGPDGDNRYSARFPSLSPDGPDDRYLLLWAGNARPTGGNHLSATSVPFNPTKSAGDLNWVMSARETSLKSGGPLFAGAVSAAGEDGLVVTGGFGALTRLSSEGSVVWSLPTGDFVSEPTGRPLTAGDGALLLPGQPGRGETSGHLNAVSAAGGPKWELGAAEGPWRPLAEGPDSVLYAASRSGVTALQPDGEKRWEFPTAGFTPAAAPLVDPAGRLLLAAVSDEGSGRSRVYSLSFSGVPNWTLDLDWPVGDDYALALGPDGTTYVGGTSLGAVSTDGRLQWEIGLGSDPGGNCHPVVGMRGQVLCASGNSVRAFGKAGERIWSFQADDEEETFGLYVAVDQAGAVYAVSTRQGPSGPEGRLYALDGLGKLSWKRVLSGEGFEETVPSFDLAGNLYLASDQGSLFSIWTGNPLAEGGWVVAGGDVRHSGRRAVTEAQHLYFAQFADGAGALSSQLILLNPNRSGEIEARLHLRDDSGRPLTVDLNGSTVSGEINVPVPAEGLRTLATDSFGGLQVGSVSVDSDEGLAGLILFGGSVGLAGVGASAEQLSSFLVPIEVRRGIGLNTGVAMMNLEDWDQQVRLELLDRDGRSLARSSLSGGGSLAAGGHLARYADGFQWDQPVDFSEFAGLLKVSGTGRLSATSIQTRPGQYATMPVTAWSDRQWGKLLNRSLQTQVEAGETTPYRLQFAQFANGTAGSNALFSEILIFNPDQSSSAQANVLLRDDSGDPIQVDLNGEIVNGDVRLALPPLGLRTLRTDGRGPVVTGSVTVESDQPLSGVIVFGGSVGLAGVGSSQELAAGFLAPMEADTVQGVDTGIAFVNLEERETALALSLLDPDGAVVARARLEGAQALPARGHRALFVDQIGWDDPVDFSHFIGSLKVGADGLIAATVLQTRPNQFATMPVVPMAPPREP